uniref:Uncharacterized protein n=1 Tax=Tetranychus urticae TaxID=32264 RepID=T1KNC8_TETUR
MAFYPMGLAPKQGQSQSLNIVS